MKNAGRRARRTWFINGRKDEGRRAHTSSPEATCSPRPCCESTAAYEDACERGGMIDFAELLLRSHELWLENSGLLEHYQRRFGHLLVDEFQDTNTIQYAWLRCLPAKPVRSWSWATTTSPSTAGAVRVSRTSIAFSRTSRRPRHSPRAELSLHRKDPRGGERADRAQ